jgi:hypothetical protein
MTGIRNSCKRKQSLCIICRTSENHQVKEYYKKYCEILKKVLTEAKKSFYNKQIESSSKKVKTTWKIIKESTGKVQSTDIIKEINIEAGQITDEQEIANTFNT